ncbi:MAG: sigma-70 family RNA polymerase sigma factor [Planctomycetes bacterium]|nr:sigma-70 family RNA polymerase sigma factor [Planctomycetota bacterium]
MDKEDRQLVQRVLSGDIQAFNGLVKKYNRLAGALSYAICGDFQMAEDLVQEAFLKAYSSLRSLRDPGKFKVWLAGIVKSKTIDYVRQRKSFWSIPPDSTFGSAESESLGLNSAEDLVLKEEFRNKILEAIRGLPEADRLVIALKHMEGLSYKEIAEITGDSVNAIESRLFRARATLRKKLDHLLKC